jgi:hypothetical protein
VRRWCIPAEANGAFVAAMEDILDVYARPPDPHRPLMCFDEAGKELQDHARPPQPLAPGQPATIDTEYRRSGSANLCLAVAPHLGWRSIQVTERRTAHDFAHALQSLVDHFPEAEQIVLVLDNLNTHTAGALYQAFPPAEARRIWQRCEVHSTPKHGSWLNMAELEVSVLQRQCLSRRIPTRETLEREVAAWVEPRNAAAVPIVWSFTVEDARTKLPHTYPVLDEDTIDVPSY